ncbi:hypothetical protein [Hominiventricola filiformis]|uniref:Uncharacterized protein n=1 Tax=Hominiventricola filiformis TaxID=2885352 RepID=A0AAE3A7X1_9FIRM|nr:hypothetical protein [Hominiventricola filiformis]MCC2125078.1 hypothetical protein [Hominiventricola filiformis]
MKKVYTKYDYIDIYSKLGVMTGTFAAVSISLSLFLGFVITLAGHAHPDLSSRICLLLFVLNLPVVLRNIKRYRAIQNKLQRKHSDDAEENVTSQIILPTRKQLWGGMILLAVLAFTILFLSVLMLWLMISYYENIFLILFIFLGSLSLPVLAVMVTYIRLLVITKNLCQ